ncbi:hypothetical protein AMJ49_04645 [Parcubacteria bacterium DG_74_2]|nr:MAG: hypothetical protein AMJ49_04645 [Parcubacteria bacterium DG_74_2]
MISLKITTYKNKRRFEKVGKYYVYFNGRFIQSKDDKTKLYLKFKNYIFGSIYKKKKIIEIHRNLDNGLPFYYIKKSNKFFLSTHIKFFIKNALQIKENKKIIPELLSYGYIVPPQTVYESIYRISILKKLKIDLNKDISSNQVDLLTIPKLKQKRSHFSSLIEENINFNKKKKYTLFFSGGLDSSVLCSLMKKSKVRFNMYSTGFEFNSEDFLEKNYSLTASILLNKKTKYVSFNFNELLCLLPEIIFATEEPIGHIQTLLFYALIKKNKKYFNPILVNGQGADSIFGTNSQYNFLNKKTKLNSLKIKIPKYSFLKKDYVSSIKKNRKLFLLNLKDFSDLDKDFVFNLRGDTDITLNCWTKCVNYNSLFIIYPLFQKKFISEINKLKWETRIRESKYYLKKLARENNIPKRLIYRKKGTFGPISKAWSKSFFSLLPLCYDYFDKKGFKNMKRKENRYILWNIINYSIWRKIFIENKSYKKIEKEIEKIIRNKNENKKY